MFALHGLWRADRRLALWAEDAARSAPAGSAVAPRANADPAPHPFAAPPATLRELLGAVGPGLEWLAGQAEEEDTLLLLPTVEGAPQPSPEISFPQSGDSRALAVPAPWRVPGLLFDAEQAAQLLGALHDPRRQAVHPDLPGRGPTEAAFGASLRWLTALHDLAWRLAGRGRVLPGVEPESLPDAAGTPQLARAVWRPAPEAAELRELAGLTAACPPACRAEAGARRGAAGLAEELLAVLTDREVRAALAHLPAVTVEAGEEATAQLLAALAAPDGLLPARVGWPELTEALRTWQSGGEGAPSAALRLGFRLLEPSGDEATEAVDDRWWLELVLAPADEPSQFVTAAEFWSDGAAAAVLAERVPAAHAVFALELNRAARLHPLLGGLADEARAQGLWLDRAGALLFLREAAPLLAAGGFDVLLPSWWREPPALGMLLAAHPAQAGVVEGESLVGRDEMLAFQWRLALGGEPLTAQELADLTAAKGTLVRLRGRWLLADEARLAAALAFLDREGSGEASAREVLELVLDPREAAGLPVVSVDLEGPLRSLVTRLEDAPAAAAEPPALALPASFNAELRPYQREGVEWLAALARLGLGGVLADDMGLGKTVQTLALLAAEYAAAVPPTAPTLVVVPMSLLGNWEREAARFAPELRVHVHHGARRDSTAARFRAAAGGADLVLTTYGLVARDLDALRAVDWHRVVADEAQNLKNSATLQSRAVRTLTARHRLALTGTPIENRLAELHSVLDFVNPGLFGSAERFKERYSVAIERNASVRATALLRQRTAPFVLRRRKSDPAIAAELPGKQEMTVLCNLTVEQAALYRAVVAQLLQRIKGMGYTRDLERRGFVLAALTRLKQICNHPAQFTGEAARGAAVRLPGRSGKLARLEEILEETLAGGESSLCFTQYAQFGALLQPYLERRLDCTVRFLHGGVPERARRELVDAFQEDGRPSVFLLSLKAGGTGLNLTAASQVVHLDRWWNPAVEEQATDRAHRIGQRREVQVRRLVCVGTIEERVDELLSGKRALADAVLEPTKGGGALDLLTSLAPEALREVLTLADEAVSEL